MAGERATDGFEYRDGELYAEAIPVSALAEAAGTPVYVYSAAAIRTAFERLRRAFAPLGATPHYAVKACSNLGVLRLVHSLGAGMDVVSGGELERAWLAGVPMAEIVFAGVGKTDAEIRAALDGRFSPLADEAERLCGRPTEGRGPVGMFNVESRSELERLAAIAGELGLRARACLRVNPNVDPRTHEYTTTGMDINKFGIDADLVPGLFDAFAGRPELELAGLHVHIGSPVREVAPYVAAVEVLLALIETLEAAGHRITALDLGGGWPADYETGEAPPIEAYAEALVPLLAERVARGLAVALEPGRSIVANAGVLVTRVHHVKRGKTKRFVICDAGMHTLIRPALYRAFHFVWPARVEPRHLPPHHAQRLDLPGLVRSDLVGPVCESADFLARDRDLPEVARGDLIAVFSAGAYGMTMTSNYNDHGRPAEVMVDGDRATVIAERQSLVGLFENELRPRALAVGVRRP